MTSKSISNGILRALAIVSSILFLLYFLFEIQSVIFYIVIAAVLSLIGRPLIRFLRDRLKFPNTIAVIATMLLMLSLLTGLVVLFIPLILEQGTNLSLLHVEDLQASVQDIFNEVTAYFSSKGIDILSKLKDINFVSQFKAIPDLLNAVLGALGSLSVGLLSVLFISFFLMKDSRILENSLLTLIPSDTEGRLSKSLETINNLLSSYFIGLIIQITTLFIIYSIILLSFGISNPIVIAFLCALLNLIPYVGPLIGALIMFVLSMISNIGQDFQAVILPTSLWILFCYGLAQLIDNFVSQPLIFSKTTKSHPLEVFLVIVIGGLLFGVMGMVTAIPCYTALKVILKEFLSENKIVKSLTKDL
jgi:predicted PurR-regulated permease PerM